LLAEVTRYARWAVLGCVIAGAVAVVVVLVVSSNERSKVEERRRGWDEVHKALKEKTKPDEQIAALEGVAGKVKGTPAHAYVLINLGEIYFAQAVKPENLPEQRGAALKKAIQLFELVATQEPYRSNPAFGPLALASTAMAYEQGQDYDNGIRVLSEGLKRSDLETHFSYNKLVAQLGRLYYLRSLSKPQDSKEAQDDREQARKHVSDTLRTLRAKKDSETFNRQNEEYLRSLEYLKSLVDKPGKLLPDGKAPPAKPKPEVKPPDVTPPEVKTEGKKDEPAKVEAKPGEAKKEEPKKDETKKEDVKKEELKKDTPKEDKKQGSALPKSEDAAEAPRLSASGHITFSQIQQALKEGRTAFCQCPRCGTDDKATRAKLVE